MPILSSSIDASHYTALMCQFMRLAREYNDTGIDNCYMII